MQFRLVCGACVFALTGCFSDPPSGTSGGGSTSEGDASSSGGSAEVSTSAGETSTGGVDEGSSGGSSSGGVCVASSIMPSPVPADIVVLVDEGLPTGLVQGILTEFQSVAGNNVAILASASELAALDLDSDCPQGCGTGRCAMPANRIIVPYTGDAYAALAEFASFECVFRDPAPNTSGPVANLWFITPSPNQMPPKNLASLVLEGEVPLRVHLACPDCDADLFNANALLAQVVNASGGTVEDTNSPVRLVAQASLIGAPRHSCLWEAETEPDFYILEPRTPADPFFADPVATRADCPGLTVESGDAGAFHPDDLGVRLCPETCKASQRYPVEALDIQACE